MLQVTVLLPSGCCETLSLPEFSTVGDLKLLAQRSLRRGFLQLVTMDGHVLTNLMDSLHAAGVQEGAHLMAVVQEAKVASSRTAFALWCYGGNQVVA